MMRPPYTSLSDRTGASLSLRTVDAQELDRVLEIAESAHHAPWARAVFEREFTVDFSQVWGIEGAQGDLLGTLVFWRVHDELHVLDVAVHRGAQGRGIGKHMIEALIAFGRATEMLLITLEVREGNAPAIGLYDRCGFEAVGRRANYYADNGEDAIIMTRILASQDFLL